MKRILTILLIAVGLSSNYTARAQAFDRNTRELSLTVGAASMFHIPVTSYGFYRNFYSPLTGQLMLDGDFGIHKYVSLGFVVGLGGRAGGFAAARGYGGVYAYSGYYPEFNVQVGMIANFHFYQLIADKSSKGDRLHADKLDIYAGLNVGSGFAIHPGASYYDNNGVLVNSTALDALFFIGPQVGVRYFFKPKVGVNGEFGYGKSLVKVGFTFKL